MNHRLARKVRSGPLRPQPIEISKLPAAQRTDFYLPLFENALGSAMNVPFIVARGERPGPVLGITAAVHGNELNGIKIIQNLLGDLPPERLSGAILCAPIVNVPGYYSGQREFSDGLDLNHQFPGKAEGKPSQQYARLFVHTFLPACDYLIDIHTASEGRVNTMYVRSDLHCTMCREMAWSFNPEIVLHVHGGDGTLRNAASQRKIPAITIEAGNPNVLQGRMVFEGEVGIRNVLSLLGMIDAAPALTRETVLCRSSRWLRTTGGGLLETRFELRSRIEKKQLLAETRDPFGVVLQRYYASHDGIVIGMSANPAATPGHRFCHLGRIGDPGVEEPPEA